MTSLAKLSERLGIAPTILGIVVWIAAGVAVGRGGVAALWQYPRLGFVFMVIETTCVGFGGLFGFWMINSLIAYRTRGYRVRWLMGNDWVYEERAAKGEARCLPISREVQGPGYPAPCRVRIPAAARWAIEVPGWARDRRAEI